MAVTIVDIANSLGVTHGTVSRALRGDVKVAESTRQKVLEMAASMNYQPNRLARQLVSNKTNTISIIVPNLHNPFYAKYVEVLDDLLLAQGYQVLPLNTHNTVKREKKLVNWLAEQYVDGSICLEYDWHNHGAYMHLDSAKPLIMRRRKAGLVQCPFSSVAVDYLVAYRKLLEHFVSQGCKELGLVEVVCGAGETTLSEDNYYIRRYRDLLGNIDLKFELSNCCLVRNERSSEELYHQSCEFLKNRPGIDCLVAANMNNLPVLLAAIASCGRRIGEDIAIATYDDSLMCEYWTPGITVVSEPVEEIATQLAEMVLEKLRDPEAEIQTVAVDAQLIVRGSSRLAGH